MCMSPSVLCDNTYIHVHAALVNKGNVLFSRGEFEKAMEYYQEALCVEATCSEALYNTGLVHKKMRRYVYVQYMYNVYAAVKLSHRSLSSLLFFSLPLYVILASLT